MERVVSQNTIPTTLEYDDLPQLTSSMEFQDLSADCKAFVQFGIGLHCLYADVGASDDENAFPAERVLVPDKHNNAPIAAPTIIYAVKVPEVPEVPEVPAVAAAAPSAKDAKKPTAAAAAAVAVAAAAAAKKEMVKKLAPQTEPEHVDLLSHCYFFLLFPQGLCVARRSHPKSPAIDFSTAQTVLDDSQEAIDRLCEVDAMLEKQKAPAEWLKRVTPLRTNTASARQSLSNMADQVARELLVIAKASP